MTPDWKALAPHKPLSADDPHYVAPPDSAGERVAKWLLAGGSNTVLLGGPVGSGKSTELARCGAYLAAKGGLVCHVALDRVHNMKQISPGQVRIAVGDALRALAMKLGVNLSAELQRAVISDGPSPPETSIRHTGVSLSTREYLELAATEVQRELSNRGTVTLLIDGLEKAPEATGRAVLDVLTEVPEDMQMVVVSPWYAVFGPDRGSVARPDARREYIRAPRVHDQGPSPGRSFLIRVLLRRVPDLYPAKDSDEFDDFAEVTVNATMASGGLPRTLLQLLSTAATYGRVRRDAPWPNTTDLESAIVDQVEDIRRSLLPGDEKALLEASLTHGSQLSPERRTRLMAEGFLLERDAPGGFVLEMHPLVERALQAPGHV